MGNTSEQNTYRPNETLLTQYQEGQTLVPWRNALPVQLPDQDRLTPLRVNKIYDQQTTSRIYQLQDDLGRLYLAKQYRVPEGEGQNPRILRRASMREGKVGQILDHGLQPGQRRQMAQVINRVFNQDGFNDPNSPWYRSFFTVTEYIAHQNQSDVADHMRVDPHWAMDHIFFPLLDFFSFLEDNNISHGDIHPYNILLTLDDEFVGIDFGNASIHHPKSQHTSSRHADIIAANLSFTVGTPGYVDPRMVNRALIPAEQQKHLPNAQSDIYAAGMMMVQSLANLREDQLFYVEEHDNRMAALNIPSDIIEKHLKDWGVPGFYDPNGLGFVVMNAVSQYYKSAKKFKAALEKAVQNPQTQAWFKNQQGRTLFSQPK